jgi:hypothetical protein
MGMLHLEKDPTAEDAPAPTVGHYFEYDGKGGMKKCPAYSSVAEYAEAKLDEFRELTEASGNEMDEQLVGQPVFLAFAIKEPPECDSFTLMHKDLDLQNVFVGPKGEITGIIDWQDTLAVPRCVGYSSLPLCLRKDWDSAYDQTDPGMHMPWVFDEYRKMYAQFMKEAIGTDDDDELTTSKSVLYCAVIGAPRTAIWIAIISSISCSRRSQPCMQWINGSFLNDWAGLARGLQRRRCFGGSLVSCLEHEITPNCDIA